MRALGRRHRCPGSVEAQTLEESGLQAQQGDPIVAGVLRSLEDVSASEHRFHKVKS